MLWPRPRSLSATCPPCVRLDCALAAPPNLVRLVRHCPPCVPIFRLNSALSASPHFVRDVSALCLLGVRFGRASKPCPHIPVMCPPCVAHVSALCPLSPLWPRLQTLPAICPPRVRLVSATGPPPRVRRVSAWAAPPNLVRPCAPLLSALCICHVSALSAQRPRLWTLPALSMRRVYIACLLVSFLGIHFGPQIRPVQAQPLLEKLFGVYAGIILTPPEKLRSNKQKLRE